MAKGPLQALIQALATAAMAIMLLISLTDQGLAKTKKANTPYVKTQVAKCSNNAQRCKHRHRVGHRHGTWIITNEVAAAPGPMSNVINIAEQFDGMSERGDRTQLAQFFDDTLDLKIDPRRTAWCAAFVNGVLAKAGKETTGSIEGRSFMDWGHAVKTPQEGDVVVMKGVSRRSPTHVGFYVGSAKVNGKTYYRILGGNQSNMVKVSWFPANKVITIRRDG